MNIVNIFLGKVPYFGCVMGFHKNIIPLILPIPKYVKSHDLWIAMAANIIHANIHLDNVVLLRRLHGNNLSNVKRGIFKKIWSRIIFFTSAINLFFRIKLK